MHRSVHPQHARDPSTQRSFGKRKKPFLWFSFLGEKCRGWFLFYFSAQLMLGCCCFALPLFLMDERGVSQILNEIVDVIAARSSVCVWRGQVWKEGSEGRDKLVCVRDGRRHMLTRTLLFSFSSLFSLLSLVFLIHLAFSSSIWIIPFSCSIEYGIQFPPGSSISSPLHKDRVNTGGFAGRRRSDKVPAPRRDERLMACRHPPACMMKFGFLPRSPLSALLSHIVMNAQPRK